MRRVCPLAPLLPRLGSACAPAPRLQSSMRRGISQQPARWISRVRYGAETGLCLGAWGSAFCSTALTTRQLYCKALVCAAGGSRLARDWIAGSAALGSPNQSLLFIALQYMATEADVVRLREHILEGLIAQEVSSTSPSSSSGDTAAAAAAEAVVKEAGGDDDDDDAKDVVDAASISRAEALLLSRSPQVQCFMYDAMTASLFHCHSDLSIMEQAKMRTFSIGEKHFGLTAAELTQLWRLVEAELLVKAEKVKVLGQPWGE